MATISAVLRKSKQKHDGTIPIYIRISEGTKNKYISVGHSVLEKDWDSALQKVKRGNPNYDLINGLILKKRVEADRMVLEIRVVSDEDVLDSIAAKKEKSVKSYFFKMAEEYFQELEQMGKYTRVSGDRPRVNHLKAFLKKDVQFKNINEGLLRKFIVFLKTEQGLGERSVMNVLVVIRTIINMAIVRKMADKNDYPFGKGGITIRFPETQKIGLNEDEIHMLENADFPTDPDANHARNVFLFSFYMAGMRISDVLRLKWEDIIDGRLNYQMGKNQKIVSLRLPAKALSILDHYNVMEAENNGFVFPELKDVDPTNGKQIYRRITLSNKKFNDQLKAIAKDLGIKKTLTCHISRHSFGHITGDKISPQMLQKLYRHTSIQTTMGYQANFIHKDVDDALESVLNF
jgi:integrase/recombinase XerD